jgi:hypothetical protein
MGFSVIKRLFDIGLGVRESHVAAQQLAYGATAKMPAIR